MTILRIGCTEPRLQDAIRIILGVITDRCEVSLQTWDNGSHVLPMASEGCYEIDDIQVTIKALREKEFYLATYYDLFLEGDDMQKLVAFANTAIRKYELITKSTYTPGELVEYRWINNSWERSRSNAIDPYVEGSYSSSIDDSAQIILKTLDTFVVALHGENGTGRKAFVSQIAARKGMNISVLTPSTFTDSAAKAVARAPQNSCIVIEDMQLMTSMDKCLVMPSVVRAINSHRNTPVFIICDDISRLDDKLKSRLDMTICFGKCKREDTKRVLQGRMTAEDAAGFSKAIDKLKFTRPTLMTFLSRFSKDAFKRIEDFKALCGARSGQGQQNMYT